VDTASSISTIRRRARSTGLLYLLMTVVGAPALLFIPRFIVPGDATATMLRIADGAQSYRLLLLGDIVGSVLFAVLGWSFYALFEDVDRGLARLLLVLVLVSATLGLVDASLLSPPIMFLERSAWLVAIPKPQLDALALALLSIRSFEVRADELLWGLWLVPLGVLSIRSGFIPKLVGVAVLAAALGWVMLSVGQIAFPGSRALTDRIGNLLAQLELTMIAWLVIRGARRVAPREGNRLLMEPVA
jgi:hypothetical protein